MMNTFYPNYKKHILNSANNKSPSGIDLNFLCNSYKKEIKKYVKEIYSLSLNNKGIAIGTGNSVPDYVPVENYLIMVETIREERGE